MSEILGFIFHPQFKISTHATACLLPATNAINFSSFYYLLHHFASSRCCPLLHFSCFCTFSLFSSHYYMFPFFSSFTFLHVFIHFLCSHALLLFSFLFYLCIPHSPLLFHIIIWEYQGEATIQFFTNPLAFTIYSFHVPIIE